jgi:anti-sigma regulatory factor (Ser/Thr protein kinase)
MTGVKNCRSTMFHCRLSELRGISAFLEGFCGAAGIERQHCLRLNLVLEELFINTVRHGHGGDCDAPVWMMLEADERSVHVIYEDIAPPFNPYAHLPEGPPDTTLDLRKIGGLGVLLTKELAATRDYAYLFGRNRIRLAMSR